jgi:hypothetical protein
MRFGGNWAASNSSLSRHLSPNFRIPADKEWLIVKAKITNSYFDHVWKGFKTRVQDLCYLIFEEKNK